MRKRESMRFTKRLTFVLFLTCCLFAQPQPTQAKGIPPQIKKVLSRLKPVIKLVEPLNALLELTGVIDSLDDKIDRIAESKLNAAINFLNLARRLNDEQRRKEHISRANELLVEAEQLETEESRLLLTQYLSGAVYLGQGEFEAATHQFEKIIEHRTGQEALMIDYMERSQGYDFSKEDGLILSTNCMKKSLASKAFQFAKDINVIHTPTVVDIAVESLFNKESDKLAVILKNKVLDYFKVSEIYKAQFKPFFAKCQSCENLCCTKSCINFKMMYFSFFQPSKIHNQ
jgi:hypothetical protein